MRRAAMGAFLLVACAASACAPAKTFRLPLSPLDAHPTFAPIASVASQRGLVYAEFDDGVHVRLDDVTWAYFIVQGDEYNLVITLDRKRVPEDQREEKFAWAKKDADAIWHEAMALMRETHVPTVAPSVPASPPSTNVNVNIDL